MSTAARTFLDALFARCTHPACVTLTAIHPTQNRPVPSRHLPLHDTAELDNALEHLQVANARGWGAYFGLATRQTGLTRWQRGDRNALVEVPALIADIDAAPTIALARLRMFPISPTCIVRSGYGIHAYWLLGQPTTDMQTVKAIHRGLAQTLKGDYLTAATALRLPGTLNTKHGKTAPCEILRGDWSNCYTLADFAPYRQPSAIRTPTYKPAPRSTAPRIQNDPRIAALTDALLSQGFTWRGTWLNGPCPYAYRHKHSDCRPSFGFNIATGYGYCFVCGSMLLREVCCVIQ